MLNNIPPSTMAFSLPVKNYNVDDIGVDGNDVNDDNVDYSGVVNSVETGKAPADNDGLFF